MDSARTKREQCLQGLGEQTYDVLIVGGGITGAGIAREAAWSGLRTLLIDKSDFASGTSSRSSKLLHGGLRYLEQYEFGLVFEAVRERMAGFHLAPHLVRPMPFIFPQYEGDRPGMALMSVGLWLYDAMAGFRSFGLHQRLSPEETVAIVPDIRSEGLRGAFRYWDAQTDDTRLTLEAVLDAEILGGGVLNWANLKAAEKVGDLWCCQILDRPTGRTFEIRTRSIALAVGPWLDRVSPLFEHESRTRMRPTKGVHLLIRNDRLHVAETVVILHPRDGRVTFAIPAETGALVGTTDTDHFEPLREPEVTEDDIEYLLEGLNSMFPGLNITPEDAYSSYAGLRPLLAEGEVESESDVSREHSVFKLADGVYAIAGGKLTTWRVMAHDCLKAVRRHLRRQGIQHARGGQYQALRKRKLPGGAGLRNREELKTRIPVLQKVYGISLVSAHTALYTYGARADEVLRYARKEDRGLETVGTQEILLGMFRFAVTHEHALSLDDLMRRRSRLYFTEWDQGRELAAVIADYVAPLLNWKKEDIVREVAHYQGICHGHRPHAADETLVPEASEV